MMAAHHSPVTAVLLPLFLLILPPLAAAGSRSARVSDIFTLSLRRSYCVSAEVVVVGDRCFISVVQTSSQSVADAHYYHLVHQPHVWQCRSQRSLQKILAYSVLELQEGSIELQISKNVL